MNVRSKINLFKIIIMLAIIVMVSQIHGMKYSLADENNDISFININEAYRIINIISKPESALSFDDKIFHDFWRQIQFKKSLISEVSEKCFKTKIIGAPMDGIAHVDLTTRNPAAECSEYPVIPEAIFWLNFNSKNDILNFSKMLKAQFGHPDKNCSNEYLSHWSLRQGLSLRFSVSELTVTLSIQEKDPEDANCKLSSVSRDNLISLSEIVSLVERFKLFPPKFNNDDDIIHWLEEYGSVSIDNSQKCQRDIIVYNPKIHGIKTITATRYSLNCINELGQILDRPIADAILFNLSGGDMFAEKKFRNTLKQVYGKVADTCIFGAYPHLWAQNKSVLLQFGRDRISITTEPPMIEECKNP